MFDRSARAAFRIALIYLIVSTMWILFSDRVLENLVTDPVNLTRYQTMKGVFFVVATTVMLYLLQRRELMRSERSEQGARRSSERSLTLLNTIPDHIVRIHRDGTVRDYRGASESDFNLRAEDIINHDITNVFPPPIGETFQLTMNSVLQTFRPSIFEYSLEGDETYRFEVRMAPSGEDEVIAIIRNITEIQKVGEILRRAEHEKEVILDSLVEHVIYSNPDLEIQWANLAAVESAGLSREDLIGRHCYEIWAERDDACPDCPVKEAILKGHVVERERTTPDGRTWFIRGYPVNDEEGETIGGIEVTLEITEQKIAERALEESEIRYRSLFREAKDAIFLMQGSRFLESNQSAAEMFLTNREDIRGMVVADLSPPMQPDGQTSEVAAAERIRATMEGNPQFFTWKHMRTNGEVFDAEVSLSRIELDDTIYVQAIVRDITDRIQTTIALQQYADRLELLRQMDQAILEAHSAEDVANAAVQHLRRVGICDRASITLIDEDRGETKIIAVDFNGETKLSPGMTVRMQDPSSLEGLKTGGIRIYPDLRAIKEPSATIKQLMDEGILSYINIPLIAQGGLFGVLHVASHEAEPISEEGLEIAQEVATVLAIALHQASLHERVQRHADILEDRVEERTRELEEANSRLKELDRLKSEFVSNVSHELRTPITNIMLYLDLFNQPGREEKQTEFLSILKEEARRLSRLIEDLLTLSRLEQSDYLTNKELHVLDAIIADVFTAVSARARGRDIQLHHEINQAIPAVEVNRDQMVQVLTNLVTNAVVYSEAGKSVNVTSELCSMDDSRYICLRVHNDGSYIEAEDLPHIFERFYRGKSGQLSGEAGTGLGLAISKQIIERHRGQLEVESHPDTGTTFTIWLPINQPGRDHTA